MNKKVVAIILYCITRNAIQTLVGICIGVYLCAKNPELDTQCAVLFTVLAPIFAIVGGPTALIMSVANSMKLWQDMPPVLGNEKPEDK